MAKIRMGFVSNSSSSSFCIYGTNIDNDDFEKLATGMGFTWDEEDEFDWYEFSESEFIGDLSIINAGDEFYIGREWSSVGDNETGKQFKDSVETILKKHIDDVKCDTIEETYYD